jgi:hypothetical protein
MPARHWSKALSDWLDLKADYFEPVCRSVFDAYLKRHRFGPGRADEAGCLAYRRGRCVLEIHYYVEESPNFSPMVTIGLVPKFALRPRLGAIGLWYAVPEGAEAHDYGSWRFSNADELRVAMSRVRDEVVEVYARPLWEQSKTLAALIVKRMAEVDAERNAEILRRKKSEAEAAFVSRDYGKAAALYGRMRESELSALERKRFAYAKKQLA